MRKRSASHSWTRSILVQRDDQKEPLKKCGGFRKGGDTDLFDRNGELSAQLKGVSEKKNRNAKLRTLKRGREINQAAHNREPRKLRATPRGEKKYFIKETESKKVIETQTISILMAKKEPGFKNAA